MSAEALGVEVVRSCLSVAAINDPQDFQTWFCGAIIANVIGNLTDEYWEQCKDKKPCGRTGCDCHLQFADFMVKLDELREDHKQYVVKGIVE